MRPRRRGAAGRGRGAASHRYRAALLAGYAGSSLAVTADEMPAAAVPGGWRTLVLTLNYIGVSFLALYMVAWILHFPASWRAGDPDHDAVTQQAFENASGRGVVGPEQFKYPQSVITKYKDHPAVQLTHILPGAFWSATIPFQFHPSSRKRFPRLHRAVGYGFFACSLSITVGLAIMHARDLYWHNHDFGIPARVPGNPEIEDNGRADGAKIIGTWFVVTAFLALRAAQRREFAAHKRWIYRHVGAGIWVAVQRIFVELVENETALQQRVNFGRGAGVGWVTTVLCAELAVAALPAAPARKKAA
jgi:hypothetical protein